MNNTIINIILMVKAAAAEEETCGMSLKELQMAAHLVAIMKMTDSPLRLLQCANELNSLLGMGATQMELVLDLSEILREEDKLKNDFPNLFP